MPPTDTHLLGPILLAILALLAGYLGILRIREFFTEKPDPKLTYATRSELEKTRNRIETLQAQSRTDIERLRTEFQSEHIEMNRRLTSHASNTHALIQKNAEHVAALIAQTQAISQRLSELALKTDRILQRPPCRHPNT